MQVFLFITAGLCGLAALGIVIAATGTPAVPTSFAVWALPFAAGALALAWIGRRIGQGRRP
ncbi:MAG: hypothetical protein QNJ94_17835 [Alphaproteobacteria bacterium]|nr:hypothetical protein [Alphaproteobacteria bacterium]